MKEKYSKEVKNVSEAELKAARENVRKKTSAALLLIGADHGRQDEMKNCFQQNRAMGKNNYARSINETKNVLNTFVKISKGGSEKKTTRLRIQE